MTIIEERLKTFNSFAIKKRPPLLSMDEFSDIFMVSPDIDSQEILEGRLQKAFMSFVKYKLDADPSYNQKFVDKTDWEWLNKLLTAARIRELTSIKIVKKGGRTTGLRFDITEFSKSFYGTKILESLNFNPSRKSVNINELDAIKEACANIKLKLPEEIQPTTTEVFFDENNHA